jgi:DNA repair exonuclease SbcCD ATPase subunit
MRKLDEAAKNKEVAKITARTNAQLRNMSDDLHSMTEAKEKIEFEWKRLLNGEKNLISIAGQYFESPFQNISDVTSFLQSTLSEYLRAKHKPCEPVAPSREFLDLENQIHQLKSEKDAINIQYRTETDGLKREIEQVRTDSELKIIDHRHRISVLEGQIQGLEEELNRVSSETRKSAASAEIEQLSNELLSSNEKNASLQIQLRKLEGQLTSLAQSSSHEKTTNHHREERLRAQILDLETRIEAKEVQLRSNADKIRDDDDRHERIEKTLRHFLGNICSVLSLRQLSTDEFLSTRVIESIGSALLELRSNYDQAKRRSADLTVILNQFRESFQLEEVSDASAIGGFVIDIRAKLDRQHEIILRGKKRHAELQERLVELQQAVEAASVESADLSEQLKESYARYNDSLAQLNEKDGVIRQLNGQLQQIRSDLMERETELQSLQQENSVNEKRIAEERDEYENAIQRIRNQSELLRRELQETNSQLQTAERDAKRFQKQVTELELQIERMERESNAKMDQLVREKKLIEAEARSKVTTAESDFITRLDEAKKNLEQEQRRLIGYVLDQFREFFNRKGAIDEDSLREVVVAVRNQLHRLKKSDDRIRTALRATGAQKTDDAVTLMMSHGESQRRPRK